MAINTRLLNLMHMYGKKAAVVGLLCAFTVSLSGCYFFPKEDEVLAPPLKAPDQITYQTIDVKKDTIQRKIEGNAILVSAAQKDIIFRDTGGRLKDIYVKTGDDVKAGDVLAELDNEGIKDQIKQQEIALQRAELSYDQQKLMAKLDIDSAKHKLNKLKEEYNKKASTGAASNAELDNLKEQIDDQETNLYKLEQLYGPDGNGEGYSLKQAALGLQEARMRMDELKDSLEKTKLVAPFSGSVIYVDERIKEGAYVDPYQVLMRMADPTQLQLQYSAGDASELRIGMNVDVTFRTSPKIDKSKVFPGKVVMTPSEVPANASQEAKKSVIIKVDNLPKEASIGEYAYISVLMEESKDTIVVPRSTIQKLAGGEFIYVLVDGIREEREVKLGIRNQTHAEVLDGLQVGDKVLLR